MEQSLENRPLPKPNTPEWYEFTQTAIWDVERALWTRIQAGEWRDPAEAEAAVGAHKAVLKVRQIVQEQLSQTRMAIEGQ